MTIQAKLYFYIAMGVRQEQLHDSGLTEADFNGFLKSQGAILARDLAACPECHQADFRHNPGCLLAKVIDLTMDALRRNLGTLDDMAAQAKRKGMQ
jgi:hypothetical protein